MQRMYDITKSWHGGKPFWKISSKSALSDKHSLYN